MLILMVTVVAVVGVNVMLSAQLSGRIHLSSHAFTKAYVMPDLHICAMAPCWSDLALSMLTSHATPMTEIDECVVHEPWIRSQ